MQLMQGAEQLIPRGKFVDELNVIKGIIFTPREINIISCLMRMRGPDKISSLLDISPNTVTAHIRNIRLKIGCNSREGIIDFFEGSRVIPLLNKHYFDLMTHVAFEKCLKDLAAKETKQAHLLIYEENQSFNTKLVEELEKHLKQAGIKVIFTRLHINEDKILEQLKNAPPGPYTFFEEN